MVHHPQIDPIFKWGTNGAGVLLLHGFTGTPDSLRPLANCLHQEGFTVSAPLLEGHGTTPEKLAATRWNDWYHSAQQAFMELQQNCPKIFVAGLSLGGLLTLKLAIDSPHSITAISSLATPLHLKKWVEVLLPGVMATPLKNFWKYQRKFTVDIKDPAAKENFWNYDLMPLSCVNEILDLQHKVEESLSKIVTPILLIHSRHDNTAPYSSMNDIASRVQSAVTETVTLENSYHVITLDYEKDLVAQKVTDFFKRFV